MGIAEFFDGCAAHWDDSYVPGLPARKTAAEIADVRGKRVLDAACGTGVMFPELLEAGAESITGIDISPEMIKLAKEKFANEAKISLICADIYDYSGEYDSIMFYNCYPHFLDKSALVRKTASLLTCGGRFTIAHGMGRETLNRHHAGLDSSISTDLMDVQTEAKPWAELFDIDRIEENDSFYLISGTLKSRRTEE